MSQHTPQSSRLSGRTLLWWGQVEEFHLPHLEALSNANMNFVFVGVGVERAALLRSFAESRGSQVRSIETMPSRWEQQEPGRWIQEIGDFDDFCYVPDWTPTGRSLRQLTPAYFQQLLDEMGWLYTFLSRLSELRQLNTTRLCLQLLPDLPEDDQKVSLSLLVQLWGQILMEVLAHECEATTLCLCSLQLDGTSESARQTSLAAFFEAALERPEAFQGIHHETILSALRLHGPLLGPLSSPEGKEELRDIAQQISGIAASLETELRQISLNFDKLGFLRRRQERKRFRQDAGLMIDDWIAQFQRMSISWHHLAVLRNETQAPLYMQDLLRSEKRSRQALKQLDFFLEKPPREVPVEQEQRFRYISQRRQKMREEIRSLEEKLLRVQRELERVESHQT